MLKRISVGLLAIIICAICLEIGERVEIPGVHSFVSTAEAIIGRPLTPMSYAGVARGPRDAAPRASTTVRPQRPLGEADLKDDASGRLPARLGSRQLAVHFR